MEEKKLEELTINELKELAESDGIKVTTTKKADIIEEINKAREVDTTDNVENNQNDAEIKEGWAVTQEADGKVHVRPTENGEIIDTPVEKVIKADGTVEDIEIPKGFVKKSNLNKKEYGYHNGRKYKKMKNGYGMWADNGQSFLLSELK